MKTERLTAAKMWAGVAASNVVAGASRRGAMSAARYQAQAEFWAGADVGRQVSETPLCQSQALTA